MATPVPMLTPNDPKAPKFAGDGRTLVQFLADYGRMADAAQLQPFEKCNRLVAYLSAEVREDVEQYDEYNGLDATNTAADAWAKLEKRFLKDYPDAKKVREITRDEYHSFIENCKSRVISKEDELHAFTREFRRYTTKLLKTGLLSTPEVSTAFYEVLLRNLGHDLTLALRLKKPDTDDFTIDEIVECATRLIKKKANSSGIGLVFEPVVMSARVATTNPAPLAGVVKKEELTPSLYESLMARIATLEKERDAAKKNPMGTSQSIAPTLRPNHCFYCPSKDHTMRDCPTLEEDLKLGRCKRENGRVVFPDGTAIPGGPGRLLGDLVNEYHKHKQTTVSAMLVEIGDVCDSAPNPRFEDDAVDAEQSWLAAMVEKAQAFQQELANRPANRTSPRFQKNAPTGRPRADTSRDPPPHVGKQPGNEAEPRAAPAADKLEAIQKGEARFAPQNKDPRPLQEGTPRVAPPLIPAEPARPQYRVQAPVESDSIAKRICDRALDAQVVMTLEELAAISPEVQRYVRMKVTPRRVAIGSVEESAAEVWLYRVVEEGEDDWSTDLVTAQPSLPLRYLDCRVGRFEVEGVLDGGAQLVIISKRLWVELGRPIDSNFPRLTLEAANNSKNKTLGLCANLEVKIFGLKFYLHAHVVEEAPFDLLLGRPFFAVAQTSEDTLQSGESFITLRDPNSEQKLRVPTKERMAKGKPQPHGNSASVTLPHF